MAFLSPLSNSVLLLLKERICLHKLRYPAREIDSAMPLDHFEISLAQWHVLWYGSMIAP